MSPDEDVLAFRLSAVEQSITHLNAKLDKVTAHVDERFDRVQGSITGLQFVRQDVYGVEMRGRREYEEETRRIASASLAAAEGANSSIKWAVGIIVLIVLAVLGAFTWVAA